MADHAEQPAAAVDDGQRVHPVPFEQLDDLVARGDDVYSEGRSGEVADWPAVVGQRKRLHVHHAFETAFGIDEVERPCTADRRPPDALQGGGNRLFAGERHGRTVHPASGSAGRQVDQTLEFAAGLRRQRAEKGIELFSLKSWNQTEN